MQKPLRPHNEPERLKALKESGLLDSPPEERFDRITRLAKHMFSVPIALVSLIDADRQWFKSNQGLGAEETHRDISFCGHAILSPNLYLICDASKDPRFLDNPLVTGEPFIRFYAGVPIMIRPGITIGTLCIIDSKPRVFNDEQASALKELANIIVSEIQRNDLIKFFNIRDLVVKTQRRFIQNVNRKEVFSELLTDLLALTHSEYGFIGEVLYDDKNQPYLKSYALTNNALNDEISLAHQQYEQTGLEFRNLKSLLGVVLKSGKSLISNEPAKHPNNGGLPEGHPAMTSFMGLPVFHDGQLVAMLGLANRPQGYQQQLIDDLQPLITTAGQLVQVMRMQHDHQQALKSVYRLSRIVNQTTNGIVITNCAGKVEWLNDSFERLSGYSLEDMQGKKPGQVLQGPLTDAAVIAIMGTALRLKQHFEVELVNYTKSGQPYWVKISCSPHYAEDGTHEGFIAIESDVTAEKQASAALRDNERRLSAIIEATNVGTWEWQPQTGEMVFNERWAHMLGYTLDELTPLSIDTGANLTHPDDLMLSDGLIAKHFAGETPYYDCTLRMRHKKGHWVWVHDCGKVYRWSPDKKPLLMCGTHFDVTERVAMLHDVEAQKAFLEDIFNSSVSAITVLNSEGRLLFANQGAERVLGLTIKDSGENGVAYDDPAWHICALDGGEYPSHLLPFSQVKNTGKPVFDVQHAIVWPDGQWRALSINGALFQPANSEPQYIFSSQDITKQVLAARKLSNNESRLRSLFELSPAGIALNELDSGSFISVNQSFINATGYSEAEFTQFTFWDLVAESHQPNSKTWLSQLRDNGRYGPCEQPFLRKDGSSYPASFSSILVQDSKGKFLVWSIIEDISERKHLEQLKNQFVSTVSHELRTPLTAIAGSLDLINALMFTTMPEQVQSLLLAAQRNSKRLSLLINDLLDIEKLIAGKVVFNIQRYSLLTMITNIIENIQSYADRYKVALFWTPCPADWSILVDSARFEQIMQNLMSNAIKFSEQNAKVSISVTRHENVLRISVQDQGVGISLAFKSKIFEKFAQADSADNRQKGGTGLGLAISRELTHSMGGEIGYDSVEGKGATFWVEWPIA